MWQRSPTVTRGPMIAYGPTVTSPSTWAVGSTRAVRWITGRPPSPSSPPRPPLAVHVPHAFHLARLTTELDHVQLEPDLVPRDHRAAELHVVQGHEVDDLVLDVLALEVAHQEHAAHLRHRLDDEHPGHDRVAGEMALEER